MEFVDSLRKGERREREGKWEELGTAGFFFSFFFSFLLFSCRLDGRRTDLLAALPPPPP